MIYEIELNNENANQEFDIILEEIENSIHILLQTVDNLLMMSIFANSQQIGIPFICYPNQLIVPYSYMVDILGGNFIFETPEDIYPNYENFGKTCRLYFVTKDELENA